MEEQERITELVREAMKDFPLREFRPFAMYLAGLDCLVVQTRDCSVVHHWYNGLTIYEDQYPEEAEDPYVGFEISTPGILCRFYHLPEDPVHISDLLDVLSANFERVPKEKLVIARKILDKLENQTVSLIQCVR